VNRRGFLGLLAGAAAGAVAAPVVEVPDWELWVPGKRMYFLPPRYLWQGALANELAYITRMYFVPKLIVQMYNNSPLMERLLERSTYDDTFRLPVSEGSPSLLVARERFSIRGVPIIFDGEDD
jgi:hypothetical protein